MSGADNAYNAPAGALQPPPPGMRRFVVSHAEDKSEALEVYAASPEQAALQFFKVKPMKLAIQVRGKGSRYFFYSDIVALLPEADELLQATNEQKRQAAAEVMATGAVRVMSADEKKQYLSVRSVPWIIAALLMVFFSKSCISTIINVIEKNRKMTSFDPKSVEAEEVEVHTFASFTITLPHAEIKEGEVQLPRFGGLTLKDAPVLGAYLSVKWYMVDEVDLMFTDEKLYRKVIGAGVNQMIRFSEIDVERAAVDGHPAAIGWLRGGEQNGGFVDWYCPDTGRKFEIRGVFPADAAEVEQLTRRIIESVKCHSEPEAVTGPRWLLTLEDEQFGVSSEPNADFESLDFEYIKIKPLHQVNGDVLLNHPNMFRTMAQSGLGKLTAHKVLTSHAGVRFAVGYFEVDAENAAPLAMFVKSCDFGWSYLLAVSSYLHPIEDSRLTKVYDALRCADAAEDVTELPAIRQVAATQCAADNGSGCVREALFLHDENKKKEAAQIFWKACELGNEFACEHIRAAEARQ